MYAVYNTIRSSKLFTQSLPKVSDFVGSGRKRTIAEVAIAAAGRDQDAETAELLVRGGLDPYCDDGEITVVDILSEGIMSEGRGRPLKRLCVFASTIRQQQREAYSLLAAYEVANPGLNVLHLRLTPRGQLGGIPLRNLRAYHQDKAPRVTRHLDHVARYHGAAPLALGVHHSPLQGGAFINWHVHVEVDMPPGARREKIISYLERHYEVWIGDGPDAEGSAAGLASYLRNGTARHVHRFEPDNLVEYVRQFHAGRSSLQCWQALGPLRTFQHAIKENGLRAVSGEDGDGEGYVYLAKVRPRPSYRPSPNRPSGQTLLAVRLAWIGNELRPALVVRNWSGWGDLADRYDLGGIIEAAKQAQTYTFKTANPESKTMACHRPQNSSPTTKCTTDVTVNTLGNEVPW